MDNITRRQNEMAYIADEKCFEQIIETRKKVYDYNNYPTWDTDGMDKRIRSILGSAGKNITVLPPFHCDYGFNIEVGDNFFANYNLTVLDVAKVTVGDNVFIAPNVSIYTAGHPIHYEARNTMYEYGISISIGSSCWIGGSVVTKDIPSNVIAAGNPCRVIREITDEDKKYYFKDRVFDDEAVEIMKRIKSEE